MGNIILKLDNLIRKNPVVFVVILFFVVVLITSTMYITYAYFTANIQGQGNQITISTSSGSLTFTDQNELNETGITPGTTITKTFFVTNTSNGALTYKLNWKFLKNNFYNRDNLKYSITSTGGGSLSTDKIPDSEDHINILTNTIPGNTTQTYTMTIIYEDAGQGNIDKDKNIVGKLEITNIEVDTIAPQTSNGTYNTSLAGKTTIYGITLGSLAREIYPVGSIYTSTESTDPSELFIGTTWEVYGTGRTLVGVGTGTDASGKQKSFSVNSTGGTPDEVLAYHNHGLNGDGARTLPSGAHTHEVSGNTTTGGLHTHTVPAGSISTTVTNNEEYRTRMTAMPDELAEDEDEKFEEGVYYGEHTHNFSGTGQTSATTTGASSAHSHTYQIPSLTTKAGGGKHTHTTKKVSSSNGTTLADAILNANTPSPDPVTTPGRELATTDEGLIIGPTDDYNDDTFYFRGKVEDNYVNFADLTWRVVRINGDGTVRLMLNENATSAKWQTSTETDTYQTAIDWVAYDNSPVKTAVEDWYDENIGNNSTYDNLVDIGKFCNDTSHTGSTQPVRFGAFNRIYTASSATPQFNCPNSSDIYNLKVGLITADEMAFAGAKNRSDNNDYFMYDYSGYWTMSPSGWSSDTVTVYGNQRFNCYANELLTNKENIRPVINLKANTEISGGTGTESDPYDVSGVTLATSTEASHTHTLAAGALKSTNIGNSGASGNGSSHTHSMQSIFSASSGGSSDAYVMQNKRANASLTSGAEGSHTHTIAAGNLKVYSKAAVTLPASTTKHTHSMTIPALNINSSGSHSHTTPAVSGLTTGITRTNFADKIKEDNPPTTATTTPGRQISTTDEGLITGPNDDYGSPTYYFRGNVHDNYVSFAGKTWRIIRINGDGSIRLLLNGTTGSNSMWNDEENPAASINDKKFLTDDYNMMIRWLTYENSPLKTHVENWYNTNIGNNNEYDNLVATGKYCSDKSHSGSTKPIYFGPYNRLHIPSSANPQFNCPNSNDIYNTKVGLITADEIAYAGQIYDTANENFYLYFGDRYWTMSPCAWDSNGVVYSFNVSYSAILNGNYVASTYSVHPVINIKSNVYVAGGDGTENNPYTLSSSSTSQEGSHSHNIPSLNITDVTGSTIDNNSAGTHVHTVNIPSISSRNNSAITVPSTGSSHYHDIEGTTSSTGAHTHTLVGNTSVVGTSGTNANLQPYITVYMWRRTA